MSTIKGKLHPRPERQGGQRHYPPEAAQRITLLHKFQQAGLTLTEIGEFQQDRPRRQALIRSKLGEIEQRVIDLDHAHQLMAHAREQYSIPPNTLDAEH
ncbi:MerR family transcriptional regulator [Streptomyces sp. NBC_00378]|uniref:MerR family transcriptional regulator n=1 Tax=unclassified Streptomyces TaxID=2593676 RepID=UPI00225BE273|nr:MULTISPECIES: MerR family transcriptional regulator [unclassified Streptomyces]MCX5115368.1 MerR family transcriptional regulator [Streptomyces sp. NBC_00378]